MSSDHRQAAFVGRSRATAELRRLVAEIAPTDSTVLIRGETGTGKGLLAALIHARSGRGAQPWVHVDCSAFSGSLVESELFGHERGSFTGATERRSGRFELAGSGTIFLDEIGNLEPRLQAKLLRVLHDREFERIGGSRTLRMSARVIAATNRDLEGSIHEGTFRRDLYYRLEALEVWIPPLRERTEDLEPLARHGLGKLAASGLAVPEVRDSFYAALCEHDWPGNVRELRNLLQRSVILCGDRALDDALVRRLLPARPQAVAAAVPRTLATSDGEDPRDIVAVLRATHWNVSRAAEYLQLPRSTLRYRIARLGLAREP